MTLSSIGAGALGATLLVVLYPRLTAARVAGTDIAHAVPLTVVAGLGHLWLGTVNGTLLASLLIGSVPGIVLGSFASGRMPDHIAGRLLAIVLMARRRALRPGVTLRRDTWKNDLSKRCGASASSRPRRAYTWCI